MSAPRPDEANLAIATVVATALGELRESLVFVGGCAAGFLDALPGHLPGDRGSQQRLGSLVAKLRKLARLGK